MSATEINPGALGCLVSRLQRALEHAYRLQERCISDNAFEGRNAALLQDLTREFERAARHNCNLLRPAQTPTRRELSEEYHAILRFPERTAGASLAQEGGSRLSARGGQTPIDPEPVSP